MLDVSVAYNRYKFLGYEFLTWLWFVIENHPDDLTVGEEAADITIGNKIIIENHQDNRMETLSIKGDHANFDEGLLALKKGAMVTELHLLFQEDQNIWQVTIKGENINLLSIKHPETGSVETSDDTEGFVLEKIYHYQKIMTYMDSFYNKFIHLRLSDQWINTIVPRIKKWIGASSK